ncbi:MAG: ANTAR domain-containing protein [Frankiaceae bacterium]|nr:ANTAR domain-containing protein [Frankiaceae bacterium]
MSPRDLDEWQQTLDLADAELRDREHQALQATPSPQELQAFAAEHDKLAVDRDALADARDQQATDRDVSAFARDVRGSRRDRAARERPDDHSLASLDRFMSGADRDLAAGDRADSLDDRRRATEARRQAADARQRAAEERSSGADREDDLQRRVTELTDALRAQLIIGQAQGLVMARYEIDQDAAVRLLVKLSQTQQLSVPELAARLVGDAVRSAQIVAGTADAPTP